MTYATGGDIAALDYNTFSTLTGGMNEVFGDLHSGATTLPNAAFGYGQSSLPTSVSAGNTITAVQWASLFQTMRLSGTHQGTTVVPPLPASNPSIGASIAAYNSPTTLATLVSLLRTNKLNLAVGQTSTTNASYAQPGATPWTNTLTYSFNADFGTWNNARYFFNSGGFITLSGAYSPVSTPEDAQWASTFATMNPLKFAATATTPFSGTNVGTAAGFYGLSTSYQAVYQKPYGAGGVYTNSYIQVNAKLAASAGTNGVVNFTVILVDLDPTPGAKAGTTTYTLAEFHSAGAVVYPGTATLTSLGFVSA